MAKPPPSTPHSDIDGVHEDQRRVDVAENASPDPGARLRDADRMSVGQPDESDDSEETKK